MSNVAALDFTSLVSFAENAGNAAASGADGLFEVACQVMYYGASNPKAEPSTFKAVYLAYASAQNKSAFGKQIDITNDKSVVVSASKLGTFAKVGALGYFELPELVASIVDGRAGKSGSMYELMVKINRAQIKAPERILTDLEIDDLLDPAPKKAKSMADFIAAELKRFGKFQEDELDGIDATRFANLTAMLTVVATEWLRSPDDTTVIVSHDEPTDTVAPREEVTDAEYTEILPETNVVTPDHVAALLQHFGKDATASVQ